MLRPGHPLTAQHSFPLSLNRLLTILIWQNIAEGLVTELEIFLDGDVVLDSEEDDRRGDDERAGEETPGAGELSGVWGAFTIDLPAHG